MQVVLFQKKPSHFVSIHNIIFKNFINFHEATFLYGTKGSNRVYVNWGNFLNKLRLSFQHFMAITKIS